ncbi:MAG TPA: PAS domain-containing protein, partial [Aggregatilineaceae bacterium]|nr:PAS domain-containing protein [Aggregatilineaceae bacterium]
MEPTDDEPKTHEQLVRELGELRQRIAEMEQAEAQRQRAGDARSESGSLYLHGLDDILEGCVIVGFDWRILYLNESAVRYSRQAREEMLGHTVMERYPGIENTDLFAVLRHAMEERTSGAHVYE